ncbi:glycosyltransferase [Dechloromonas sp. ARDL1]|uniref:glycosyltransferase n=1 Tax=Dechloromonas sp. ARDL1 TaxID=3322121 RepID=UPI003DA73709
MLYPTLQEAMASGLPCIATAVGGTPKLIRDGQNGRLIPPDDDKALASALWELHSQPNLARQFSIAARQTALDSFAINGMMRDYARLFS